ncbi:MAG TPA: hypothetical protein VIV57_21380 [Anaeromyxobacter sp.]
MKHLEGTQALETDGKRDFSIEGGCMLCGGALEVRVTATGARTVCRSCRWISRPHMLRSEDGVHVVHPPGGMA